MGKAIVYSVHFNIVGTTKEYKSRTQTVAVVKGYTAFEDIRKILSIPLSLKPENIDVVTLVKVEEN